MSGPPKGDSSRTTPLTDKRRDLLTRGILLAAISVAWNLAESFIAIAAGIAADSIALLGFGVDSLIELTSGAIVGWRLWAERAGRGDAEFAERIERRASRAAGALLLLLAAYVLYEAVPKLAGRGEPAVESPVGIALTAVSLIVMPLLGRAKLKTARALGSAALRADAFETITCAWLSLTTLVGLILNAATGLWWADPAAALLLVPLIVREGIEGIRGECACHGEEDEECAG